MENSKNKTDNFLKAIKKYVKTMPRYTNKQTYASGYWKA